MVFLRNGHFYMHILHLFETAQQHYDCVSGAPSVITCTFTSKEAGEQWFADEFGGSGWYFAHADELEEDRQEYWNQLI